MTGVERIARKSASLQRKYPSRNLGCRISAASCVDIVSTFRHEVFMSPSACTSL